MRNQNFIDREKLYGCTLMCYVQAPTYWFAFHLGDGKCFAFANDGTWKEPIPWDDRCFLNKTYQMPIQRQGNVTISICQP